MGFAPITDLNRWKANYRFNWIHSFYLGLKFEAWFIVTLARLLNVFSGHRNTSPISICPRTNWASKYRFHQWNWPLNWAMEVLESDDRINVCLIISPIREESLIQQFGLRKAEFWFLDKHIDFWRNIQNIDLIPNSHMYHLSAKL